MRGITITYTYSGDEAIWQTVIDTFVSALDSDTDLKGRFAYQVAIADDGETRIHWGRWDSPETLAHVQAQPYFSEFAAKVKEFAGGAPKATGHDIAAKTSNW